MAAAATANVLTAAHDFVSSIPHSRQDAKARFGPQIRPFATSSAHQAAVKEARRNVHLARDRLGLEPFGSHYASDRAVNVRKAYDDMTGLSAIILGTFQGFQYDTSGNQSKCFLAVEDALTATSNLGYVFKNVYMPWFWADAQMVSQDAIVVYGAIYLDCDVNKFFDSMTELISVEGASALGARASTSLLFAYPAWKKARKDPLVSRFYQAEKFGSLLSDVVNYTI